MFFTTKHALSSNPLLSALCTQCFFQLPNECECPFFFLDGLEGYAVNSGAPFVGTDKVVGVPDRTLTYKIKQL